MTETSSLDISLSCNILLLHLALDFHFYTNFIYCITCCYSFLTFRPCINNHHSSDNIYDAQVNLKLSQSDVQYNRFYNFQNESNNSSDQSNNNYSQSNNDYTQFQRNHIYNFHKKSNNCNNEKPNND